MWVSLPVFQSVFVYKTKEWRPNQRPEDNLWDPVYCAAPGEGEPFIKKKSAQNVRSRARVRNVLQVVHRGSSNV